MSATRPESQDFGIVRTIRHPGNKTFPTRTLRRPGYSPGPVVVRGSDAADVMFPSSLRPHNGIVGEDSHGTNARPAGSASTAEFREENVSPSGTDFSRTDAGPEGDPGTYRRSLGLTGNASSETMDSKSNRSEFMRILLVEDSERLRRSIRTALKRSGYVVDDTGDGREGLWYAEANIYDAVILDIMLPQLDGLSLLRELRARGRSTHVLLLTAKDTLEDRVHGLRSGADDYLIKPFALEELLARVEALCRRQYGAKNPRLQIGDLEIDRTRRTVHRAAVPIAVTPREFRLLELLALRRGEVVTRSEIEAHLYDDAADLLSNAVDSAICSLRKKLGRNGAAALIKTRRGHGYVLEEGP